MQWNSLLGQYYDHYKTSMTCVHVTVLEPGVGTGELTTKVLDPQSEVKDHL